MEQWIERYRRRLAFGNWMHRLAEWLAAFLFVFGGAVLVVKLLWPALWPNVLWLGIGAIPASIGAWWLARREAFSKVESTAMLDRKLNAGGLLMTLSEAPDEVWRERLPQLDSIWRNSLPRFRPIRFARMLVLPLLFAVGACLAPLREARTAPVVENQAGEHAAEELAQLLQLTEEAAIMDEKEKEELREQIAKLAEESKETPLTHEKWETVDSLRDQLVRQLDSSSFIMAGALDAADALAEASSAAGLEMSPERAAELEKKLLEALQKMNLEKGDAASKLGGALPADLAKMLKDGKFRLAKAGAERDAQLKELKDMLQKEAEKLAQCRGECMGNGLCEGQGFCFNDGLAEGNKPGRGGVSRGRGDAEMNWGDDSDAAGAKFKEVALPPGYLDQPEEDVIKTTLTAPEVAPVDSAPRAAARLDNPAAGRATWDRPLRPRHREVVRNYFDSK